MKPYKSIQDSKKVLKTLVNEARGLDNVKTRLTELNVLIKLLNSFEEMLNKKYFTEYFDILLLNKMAMYFSNKEVTSGGEVPIWQYNYELHREFEYGKLVAMNDVISQLQGHQLSKSLEDGKVDFDTDEQWNKTIENYLLDIKKQIQFKERCKK
tara:strand:- start:2481 stop:2942 length:462 start_codon:yes stop_codon:yes gene_type:complete